jgi:hypothetical protein
MHRFQVDVPVLDQEEVIVHSLYLQSHQPDLSVDQVVGYILGRKKICSGQWCHATYDQMINTLNKLNDPFALQGEAHTAANRPVWLGNYTDVANVVFKRLSFDPI